MARPIFKFLYIDQRPNDFPEKADPVIGIEISKFNSFEGCLVLNHTAEKH